MALCIFVVPLWFMKWELKGFPSSYCATTIYIVIPFTLRYGIQRLDPVACFCDIGPSFFPTCTITTNDLCPKHSSPLQGRYHFTSRLLGCVSLSLMMSRSDSRVPFLSLEWEGHILLVRACQNVPSTHDSSLPHDCCPSWGVTHGNPLGGCCPRDAQEARLSNHGHWWNYVPLFSHSLLD